ncbi:MAG: VWA domain-containing protein [Paraglaciecola sp.]|uniref:vWA domain-containing protein n=1 Tax=Pseudomonadati TaxID=3379134 RepID=UPI00273F0E6E|nr:VWA domain-containing protein [Paraglaciecola sp.]MDP5029394.1 VWA domain-containing protein [Paraglaciecola sp.]MDP5132982.1 VWA domain-containing protein [Paraglaciecola sp.]
MLVDFFFKLRDYQLPVSLRELLDLLEALEKGVIFASVDDFYHLSKLIMVKDESHFDKFDRAFADYFEGVQSLDLFGKDIPEDWLNNALNRFFTEEEKAKIKAMGGLDELMKKLQERLAEQEKRHQGGNKWIGTGGTSPFGANGYNPEGVRIGQQGNRNFSAAKVWEKREFKNLSGDVELGTRNIKVALRKLRKFARSGATEELDIHTTIGATAKNAGLLDIHMVKERHNAVKVLMFFDVGGSMDAHIKECEELFSAVQTEFKHLEFFYFHNCVYEGVWKDNKRRERETLSVWDIIHKYGRDYKVIFVGDATMGPYEITYPGGSVEHWNEEPGATWMQRLLHHFEHAIWLNPQLEDYWNYYHSITIMRELLDERMFPLTLDGLSEGIKSLIKRH